MLINIKNLGRMGYADALELQLDLLVKRQRDEIDDTLLFVEHPPVITMGKRGKHTNILLSADRLREQGVDVRPVDRGGDVTYHGPGQVVGYLIINLKNHKGSLAGFMHKLEDVFINLLADDYNIQAHRDEKHPGVWVGDEKITAMGLAVKHKVTMHGFAFNLNPDLTHFNWITPCGITDKGITSLEKLLPNTPCPTFDTLCNQITTHFCNTYSYTPQT